MSTSIGGDAASYYSGKRICVTGGAGFIGSHLVDAMVNAGADVVVFDDFSAGRRENLDTVSDRITLIEGSINDDDQLQSAIEGAVIVFHEAALTSVPRSVELPRLFLQVNTIGTQNVLDAARKAGTKRVVIASSSSVYGDQAGDAKVESMEPRPLSPYAAAKLSAEHIARAFAYCYELSSVCLRYFNIFGPRQRPDSPYAAVIPRFIDAMRHRRRPVIYGDGSQTRDFTFVDNVVHANLLAGACKTDLRGDTLNIATGGQRSLLELTHALANLLDVPADFELLPPRPGEVLHSRADISKARSVLGYEPIVSFEDGLARTATKKSKIESRKSK